MENLGSDTHPIDLAIIGGGPAGTAAALEARRCGLHVTIWERDRFPRDKVCGEFVSAESLPLLQQEIPTVLARGTPIRRVEFIARAGRRYSFSLPSPGRGLSRPVMDEALWKAAIRSGAETYDGMAVRRVARRGAGQQLWEIESAQGTRRSARSLLVACGRWWSLEGFPSPAQKGRPVGPWLGAKAHFARVSPDDAVEMYFFPGGYCGLAPIEDRRVNACCLVHRNVMRNSGASELSHFALWLKKAARHPALDERLSNAIQVSETVATAPVKPMRCLPHYFEALLAGDAAGFLDPFTGDGISQALHAGRLAAKTLARACTGERESLARTVGTYQHRLEQAVAHSYRVASLLRLLVSAPAGLQQFAATLLSGFAQRLITGTRWHGGIEESE